AARALNHEDRVALHFNGPRNWQTSLSLRGDDLMSTTMPPVPVVTETKIHQFLIAARETIAAVPVCWLATRSLDGGTNARAVSSSAGPPGSVEWTRRFL